MGLSNCNFVCLQVSKSNIIIIIIRVFCTRAGPFTASSGTKAAVLLKGSSFTASSGTQAVVY